MVLSKVTEPDASKRTEPLIEVRCHLVGGSAVSDIDFLFRAIEPSITDEITNESRVEGPYVEHNRRRGEFATA